MDLKLVLFESRTHLPKHRFLIPNHISPNTKSRPFLELWTIRWWTCPCSFQCLALCSRNPRDLTELALGAGLPCSAHPELSPALTPLQPGRSVEAQIAWTLRMEANVTLCYGSKLNPANGGRALYLRKEPTLGSSRSPHCW